MKLMLSVVLSKLSLSLQFLCVIHAGRLCDTLKTCHGETLACSIWGDCVEFHCQGEVGFLVVIKGMSVPSTPIKKPFPTEDRAIRQV